MIVARLQIFSKYGAIYRYTSGCTKYNMPWRNKPELKHYITSSIEDRLYCLTGISR